MRYLYSVERRCPSCAPHQTVAEMLNVIRERPPRHSGEHQIFFTLCPKGIKDVAAFGIDQAKAILRSASRSPKSSIEFVPYGELSRRRL